MQNGESSFGGSVALWQGGRCGMIPDGEILQTAVAVKTDAAGPNSSEWHRDLGGSVTAEGALGTALEELFR
jgi:hypothetical protein